MKTPLETAQKNHSQQVKPITKSEAKTNRKEQMISGDFKSVDNPETADNNPLETAQKIYGKIEMETLNREIEKKERLINKWDNEVNPDFREEIIEKKVELHTKISMDAFDKGKREQKQEDLKIIDKLIEKYQDANCSTIQLNQVRQALSKQKCTGCEEISTLCDKCNQEICASAQDDVEEQMKAKIDEFLKKIKEKQFNRIHCPLCQEDYGFKESIYVEDIDKTYKEVFQDG